MKDHQKKTTPKPLASNANILANQEAFSTLDFEDNRPKDVFQRKLFDTPNPNAPTTNIETKNIDRTTSLSPYVSPSIPAQRQKKPLSPYQISAKDSPNTPSVSQRKRDFTPFQLKSNQGIIQRKYFAPGDKWPGINKIKLKHQISVALSSTQHPDLKKILTKINEILDDFSPASPKLATLQKVIEIAKTREPNNEQVMSLLNDLSADISANLTADKPKPSPSPVSSPQEEAIPSSTGGASPATTKSASNVPKAAAPAPDVWKSAKRVANPALRKEHTGSADFIIAKRNFLVADSKADINKKKATTFYDENHQIEKTGEYEKTVKWLIAGGSFVDIATKGNYKSPNKIEIVITKLNATHPSDSKIKGVEFLFNKDPSFTESKNVETQKIAGITFKEADGKIGWTEKGNVNRGTATYADKKSVSLQPAGGYQLSHVRQGSLGDCYLLAALGAIVQKDPTFPNKIMKDNGDGTVTIRLYKIDTNTSYYTTGGQRGESVPKAINAEAKYIKVDKSVPASAMGKELYARDILWVQLIEKAYAAGGFPAALTAKPNYEDIAGGQGKTAYEVFLGKEAKTYNTTAYTTPEAGAKGVPKDFTGKKKTELWGKIKSAFTSGKAVSVGTRKFTADETKRAKAGGGNAGESQLEGIVEEHAYTVTAIDDNKIVLRNPHNKYGRAIDGTVLKDDPSVTLNQADFYKWFETISVSGAL